MTAQAGRTNPAEPAAPAPPAAWAALLLLALGASALAGSLLFYQAIDRQTVWEDHARCWFIDPE